MKQLYYKIGEFAEMADVSIKALRYYDQIGVLKPAYVDEETNYRFYVPEQIIQLELIKLCLSFDIPLKNMKRLKGRQTPDLKWLIYQGKEKANEQLRQAEKMLLLSDDLLKQVERLDKDREKERVYEASFEKRKVLTEPWSWTSDTDKTYLKKITKLHKTAEEKGLTVLTQQGLLMDCVKNRAYVYVTVSAESEDASLRSFPSGKYKCMMLDEASLSSLPKVLEKNKLKPRYLFCLNTDIYDFCLEHNLHRLEVQGLL